MLLSRPDSLDTVLNQGGEMRTLIFFLLLMTLALSALAQKNPPPLAPGTGIDKEFCVEFRAFCQRTCTNPNNVRPPITDAKKKAAAEKSFAACNAHCQQQFNRCMSSVEKPM